MKANGTTQLKFKIRSGSEPFEIIPGPDELILDCCRIINKMVKVSPFYTDRSIDFREVPIPVIPAREAGSGISFDHRARIMSKKL